MAERGKRVHVHITDEAAESIDRIADEYYDGNRSAAISDAILEFTGRAPVAIRKQRKRLARALYDFVVNEHDRDLDS